MARNYAFQVQLLWPGGYNARELILKNGVPARWGAYPCFLYPIFFLRGGGLLPQVQVRVPSNSAAVYILLP